VYVRSCLIAAALLLSLTPRAAAQDRRPLREARSENGRFGLRIQPGRPHRSESGSCRATLYERVGDREREHRVWRTKLANDVAPRHARIRNDGRFVVTLDEFRRGGATHAVVIYDERGRLLREFDLRELLGRDDWKHVKIQRQAVEWLLEARFDFVEASPQFVISLKWGRTVRIDLEKRELARDGPETTEPPSEADGQAAALSDSGIPPEILALLEQPTSAPAADVQAIDETAAQAVQRALEDLQRMAEASGIEVEGIGQSPATDTDAADVPITDEQPLFAGNSAEAGFPIPAPDPANPVDYMAWILEQTATDGPSAIPLYEAAIENRVPWEGDQELYDAALRGDAEALASPEIAAWLEANQDALASFRGATQFEYHGMLVPSDDGSLIGILLPNLSPMRQLARTAIVEAKVLEANGDVDAAMGDYLDNLAVGAQASQGITLIENLVGMAIQSQTAESLLDSFAAPSGEDIDYAQLAENLEAKYQPTRRITECFQGERAMVLDFVQRSYDWNPDTGHYRVSLEGLEHLDQTYELTNGDPIKVTAMAFVLAAIGFENMVGRVNEHYDALTADASLPYPDAKEALEELDAEVGSPGFRMGNPVLSMLLPSLGRAHHHATRNDTTRAATMLITNLKAYRQQHGTYPDSLDVFGDAEMVFDPFTGDRFAYHRDGDDFTLYSLGGNGVDDGGVHDRAGDTNDILFWPRPPKD
jgi:hypothetical protein